MQVIQNWDELLIEEDSCATIQRDLNMLEKRADRNIVKFKNKKCQVLHVGRNNLMHHYMLGGGG